MLLCGILVKSRDTPLVRGRSLRPFPKPIQEAHERTHHASKHVRTAYRLDKACTKTHRAHEPNCCAWTLFVLPEVLQPLYHKIIEKYIRYMGNFTFMKR